MSSLDEVRADAREMRRIWWTLCRQMREVGGLAITYTWVICRVLVATWWGRVRKDGERGARGWR